MNITRLFVFYFLILGFIHAKSQSQAAFDSFSAEVLGEAELLFKLVRATEMTPAENESERLAYQLPNGAIKSISWQSDSPNQLLTSNMYDRSLSLLNQETNPRAPSLAESVLISTYKKTKDIINSGDLDLEDQNTILKPIFTFQNQSENPDIEHSNTAIIVYLIRDDSDDEVVPMGGDFYLEFDGDGVLNDIYSIVHNYYYPNGDIEVDGKKVKGVIHGHGRTNEPIISSTEICSILLHKDMITWEKLTVTRPYTDSTFTESVYHIPSNTLTIEELPNKEFDYIPNWAVLINFGDKKYLEYFASSAEVSSNVFEKIDDSFTKGFIIYKPDEAFTKYPELRSGRLGLIEIIIKKSKIKFLPEEILNKVE